MPIEAFFSFIFFPTYFQCDFSFSNPLGINFVSAGFTYAGTLGLFVLPRIHESDSSFIYFVVYSIYHQTQIFA